MPHGATSSASRRAAGREPVGAERRYVRSRLIGVTPTPVGDIARAIAKSYDDSEVSALIDPAGVSKRKAAHMGRPSKPLTHGQGLRWGSVTSLRGSVRLSGDTPYLIASYTLNIGMYIATTMKPTMPPTSTIMTGSRIDVSALIAAAT